MLEVTLVAWEMSAINSTSLRQYLLNTTKRGLLPNYSGTFVYLGISYCGVNKFLTKQGITEVLVLSRLFPWLPYVSVTTMNPSSLCLGWAACDAKKRDRLSFRRLPVVCSSTALATRR